MCRPPGSAGDEHATGPGCRRQPGQITGVAGDDAIAGLGQQDDRCVDRIRGAGGRLQEPLYPAWGTVSAGADILRLALGAVNGPPDQGCQTLDPCWLAWRGDGDATRGSACPSAKSRSEPG